MKRTRKFISVTIAILYVLVLSGCIMEEEDPKQRVEIIPKESDAVFPGNPFTGFAAWGESEELEAFTQEWSMLFVRIFWNFLEPEKGEFRWQALEDSWNFAKAKGNRKIVLRVVLDSPQEHLEGARMEIPEWLYMEIAGKGTVYDNPEIGDGFSPDYSHPALIAEHKRFIAALGARYDSDPRIAFVQIGSLGHWGEWHTWPAGTGDFPQYGIAEKYVRHYVSAFPTKQLLVRRPLAINGNLVELGLFNDSLGEDAVWGTPMWLAWIAQGYESEWDRAFHPAMRDEWWKRACSGGELAAHADGAKHWLERGQFDVTIEQIRDCHTSWIGPSGPGNLKDSWIYQAEINELLKTMGYRYVIEKASYFNYVEPGGELSLSLVIANKGVAPIYYKWPLEISLITPLREVVYKAVIKEIDIRTLLPGVSEAELEVPIPIEIKRRRYVLAVAILNPETGMPGIDFAIDQSLRLDDGRYMLGSLFVGRDR